MATEVVCWGSITAYRGFRAEMARCEYRVRGQKSTWYGSSERPLCRIFFTSGTRESLTSLHVVLVIGLLGLLMSGSWAFRSQRVGVSFLGHIVTERLRQSATDEQKDTPVESQSTETEQPAKSHPTETRSPDELQATDTEQPGGSSDLATQRLIDDAREQLSDSPQEAVRIAYTTTRSHFNSPDEATSREFYDNTRDRVSATDDLQQLVDIYERAMFREQIERDEAEKAVEAASTLISEVK